jgi:hypothetical protein
VEGNGKPLASTVECGNGCPNIEAKEIVVREKQYNNNNYREREKCSPKIMLQSISHMPTTTLEELAILNAEPLDSEFFLDIHKVVDQREEERLNRNE